MPDLDVSDVLLDPLFCEQIVVNRILQTLSDLGRSVTTTTVLNPFGVVLAPAADPNVREEDYEHQKQNIVVHAYNFVFRGPWDGGQADEILWHGNLYVVRKLHDFSQFGVGFTAVDCDMKNLLGPA